jgi:prophage tail gpP-like protein
MSGEEKLSPIDAENRVSLEVGGVRFEGWKSVRIKHSIEQLAGTFTLDVSERWPDQTEAFTIEPGASCTVSIGDDVMITGYIDVVRVKADANTHTITIEGRDKTGDLVDCSAPSKEWLDMAFEDIATELLDPYGIPLVTQVATSGAGYAPNKGKGKHGKGGKAKGKKSPAKAAAGGGSKLPRKATNSGETVHKLLDKMAKIQGVMLISDRLGGLMVTRAGLNGAASDVLELGENLKVIDYERSFANLFSEITVKSQVNGAVAGGGGQTDGNINTKQSGVVARLSAAGGGQTTARFVGKQKSKASVTVSTQGVERYRPLMIVAEDQADDERCMQRAMWEAGTREGKSKRLTVDVQGWRQSDGTIWEINTLVNMVCPWVKEDQDMLISGVEYILDDHGGTICKMTVFAPEAYDVLPEIPQTDKHSGAAAAAPRKLSGAGR